MTVWIKAHPILTGLAVYYALAIAAIVYCVSTASQDHEEPL